MSSKRSKLTKTAAAGAAGFGLAAWLRDSARRERLRRVILGIRDTLRSPLPTEVSLLDGEAEAGHTGNAHAPGHRHLQAPADERPPPQATAPAEHTVVSHRPGHVHKG